MKSGENVKHVAFHPEKILDTIALCEGYDGIGLGLSLVEPAYRNICGVEREIFPVANMVKKTEKIFMDEKPQWSDVSSFRIPRLRGLVDCITAGIPCQPFSCAGKQLGTADKRWIWPSIRDIVDDIRPGILFFEEVSGFKKHGLPILLRDIAKIGYDAVWDNFRAPDVEAPHKKRERIFIFARLAHTDTGRRPSWRAESAGQRRESDVNESGLQIECASQKNPWPARDGETQFGWEPPRGGISGPIEPTLGRDAYGITSRLDELRLCGNGVIPAMAGLAWAVLKTRLAAHRD